MHTESPLLQVESFRQSWLALFYRLGAEPSVAGRLFDDLKARYGESHRHYHNLEHIREVLRVVDHFAGQACDRDAITLAVWYHDAIYDPRANDNEERSADLAIEQLTEAGVARDLIETVARMVRSTAHSGEPASDDNDSHILLDADLSILASDRGRYERYAADIRREYDWVDDASYRDGRARVLRGFLERPRIYRTQPMREKCEAAARENLTAELLRL